MIFLIFLHELKVQPTRKNDSAFFVENSYYAQNRINVEFLGLSQQFLTFFF